MNAKNVKDQCSKCGAINGGTQATDAITMLRNEARIFSSALAKAFPDAQTKRAAALLLSGNACSGLAAATAKDIENTLPSELNDVFYGRTTACILLKIFSTDSPVEAAALLHMAISMCAGKAKRPL